jgi:hypothetical protein
MTSSIRAYATDLSAATGALETNIYSALILLSIKVASANALIIGFRDTKQLSDSRTDYFGRIAIGMTHDGSGATVQLKIGNEVIPYGPITTAQELFSSYERQCTNLETKTMKVHLCKSIQGCLLQERTYKSLLLQIPQT